MARALLIVDVQNDFTEGGALGVTGGAALAARVTEYLRHASEDYDLIVASRDWHTPGQDNGGHFAHAGEAPDMTETWPEHCVAGTEGAEYHPALDLSAITLHVRKGMGQPAYSAFEGQTTDGRDLAEALNEAGITELDLAGLATDYCVLASALDARDLGLHVRLLSDLIEGISPETSMAALTQMAARGVEISR